MLKNVANNKFYCFFLNLGVNFASLILSCGFADGYRFFSLSRIDIQTASVQLRVRTEICRLFKNIVIITQFSLQKTAIIHF